MIDLIRTIRRRGEHGASAVEYALLIAGIAALICAIVFVFGGAVAKLFSSTCGSFSSQGTSTTATC